jgi:hypothetical protein
MRKEGSTLHLTLDVDQEPKARVETLWRLSENGLSTLLKGDRRKEYIVGIGSKSRGSIQYAPAADGKKIRVDSFLIPLAELHRKPGDKIRLAFYGQSAVPGFDFNSSGVRFSTRNGGQGPMLASADVADLGSHEFTIGEQTGTIDPAQVPDPRVK